MRLLYSTVWPLYATVSLLCQHLQMRCVVASLYMQSGIHCLIVC